MRYIIWFLLVGCTPRTVVKTQEVKVPVRYCPAPPEVPRPSLQILADITDETTDGDVVVRYEAGMKSIQRYAVELESVVKLYKEKR